MSPSLIVLIIAYVLFAAWALAPRRGGNPRSTRGERASVLGGVGPSGGTSGTSPPSRPQALVFPWEPAPYDREADLPDWARKTLTDIWTLP